MYNMEFIFGTRISNCIIDWMYIIYFWSHAKKYCIVAICANDATSWDSFWSEICNNSRPNKLDLVTLLKLKKVKSQDVQNFSYVLQMYIL